MLMKTILRRPRSPHETTSVPLSLRLSDRYASSYLCSELVLSGTYTGSMNVPHTAYEGVGDLNLQANELDAQGHFDVVRDGTHYRGQNAGSAYLYKAKPFVDLDFRVSYAISLTSLVKLTLDAGVQNFLNAYQKGYRYGSWTSFGLHLWA